MLTPYELKKEAKKHLAYRKKLDDLKAEAHVDGGEYAECLMEYFSHMHIYAPSFIDAYAQRELREACNE